MMDRKKIVLKDRRVLLMKQKRIENIKHYSARDTEEQLEVKVQMVRKRVSKKDTKYKKELCFQGNKSRR